MRKALRYVFPEHWSFLLGEIALYSFVVLVATGVYLALFFTPDVGGTVVYHGPFDTLRGMEVTPAYRSTLELSSTVPGGLLARQTHHWAALVFVAAMIVHLLRVFFTGAFRRPRELTWLLGVSLLAMGVFEGFAGYSLPDDLLSGMGLAIAYGVALSIPFLGGAIGALLWGGEFPGPGVIESRLYIAHVFVLPAIMAAVIAAHLALIVRHKHTQFPAPGRREDNVVGTPLWPGYALRSVGLLCAVAAVLVLLGGLVQVNPVWQWGPYELDRATNGAQPDWYLGWLIGALRLVPGFDVTIGGRTIVPNPFWGGAGFPLVVLALLATWPWLERRFTGDRSSHNVLDRPRDAPLRTGLGLGFLVWVFLIFFAGSSDRFFVWLGIPYVTQIWFWRFGVWIFPVIVGVVAYRACKALQGAERIEAEREAAEEEARREAEPPVPAGEPP
jgi:ubiquinol-cytochrome c reductase cytochrome b subunit